MISVSRNSCLCARGAVSDTSVFRFGTDKENNDPQNRCTAQLLPPEQGNGNTGSKAAQSVGAAYPCTSHWALYPCTNQWALHPCASQWVLCPCISQWVLCPKLTSKWELHPCTTQFMSAASLHAVNRRCIPAHGKRRFFH